MPVKVCIVAHSMPRSFLEAVLDALASINGGLYHGGIVKAAPWTLRWVPDPVYICDDNGCMLATEATFADASQLALVGQGSCGPLAAAYAGYLRAKGRDAVVSLRNAFGPHSWHAVCVSGGSVFDPQKIGGGK
jgi:hypothetical protein